MKHPKETKRGFKIQASDQCPSCGAFHTVMRDCEDTCVLCGEKLYVFSSNDMLKNFLATQDNVVQFPIKKKGR